MGLVLCTTTTMRNVTKNLYNIVDSVSIFLLANTPAPDGPQATGVIRHGFNNLLPGNKLRHASDRENKGSVEWKMEERPKLLTEGAEVLAVKGVKVYHVEEVLFSSISLYPGIPTVALI